SSDSHELLLYVTFHSAVADMDETKGPIAYPSIQQLFSDLPVYHLLFINQRLTRAQFRATFDTWDYYEDLSDRHTCVPYLGVFLNEFPMHAFSTATQCWFEHVYFALEVEHNQKLCVNACITHLMHTYSIFQTKDELLGNIHVLLDAFAHLLYLSPHEMDAIIRNLTLTVQNEQLNLYALLNDASNLTHSVRSYTVLAEGQQHIECEFRRELNVIRKEAFVSDVGLMNHVLSV
ncbi:MAG: hypothetical protein ACRC5C_03395, partial [Bacilli bacterium]